MSKKIRELQARKADLVKSARAITEKADVEARDLSIAEQGEFDKMSASIQSANAAIDREQLLSAEEAQITRLAASVAVPYGAGIHVEERIEQDPRRGFCNFGDFARSVAQVTARGQMDERLNRINAVAPTTFGNEAAGADGGFAIPPEFSTELWRLSLGEDSLIPLTQNTEVTGNSMIFPKDETTPWGGSGVQTYWQAEAGAATQSKPQLSAEALVLQKLMTLVPVTNEMIDDGFAIGSYLSAVAPERITYKINESILFGDGVGKPSGALNSAARIIQAKDSGQATGTISSPNLSNMVSRLLVGQLKNAIWIGNPDVLPGLEAMAVGNYPIFLPNYTAAESSYGMLKGRPLILSEHAAAFSSQGDLNLLSLKGYRTITKAGGIQTSTSMHLYFDADATAFKFTFRINGKPILSTPVVPPKSSNTRSHFISLAAR